MSEYPKHRELVSDLEEQRLKLHAYRDKFGYEEYEKRIKEFIDKIIQEYPNKNDRERCAMWHLLAKSSPLFREEENFIGEPLIVDFEGECSVRHMIDELPK